VDRAILGFCTLLVSPRRLGRMAVTLKTSTLLRIHRALVKRKYRLLYRFPRRRPGPKGPSRELIDAVVEMKRRNRTSAAARSPSKSLAPPASTSTRVSSGAFCFGILRRHRMAVVPPGSRLSGMPRTACGASICFASNQSCSRVTGSWW
jgi:hypothetical protein